MNNRFWGDKELIQPEKEIEIVLSIPQVHPFRSGLIYLSDTGCPLQLKQALHFPLNFMRNYSAQ